MGSAWCNVYTWGEQATVAVKCSVGKRGGLLVAYCRRLKHGSMSCSRLGLIRQVKELVTLSSVPVRGTSVLYARRVEEVVAARSDCGEPWRDANGVRGEGVFVRWILFVVRTMIIAIVAATDVLLTPRLSFAVLADTVRVCMCVYTPPWPSQRPRRGRL